MTWEIIKVEGDFFEIKLKFSNPIQISQYELPDFIFIRLNLADFVDDNDQSLPDNFILKAYLPRMVDAGTPTETIEATGKTAGSCTKAVFSFELIVGIAFSTSLH